MFEITLSAFLIMLASLSGIIFLWTVARNILEKHIHIFSSFSAGVFLVVALNLADEALNHSGHSIEGLTWIVVGILLLLVMFKLLPLFHHHHSSDQDHHHHNLEDAHKILFSDAIHNLGDGILLAASFSINNELGFITVFAIFIHEFILEISEFFVLKEAGYSTRKALSLNFLISGTILIGAFGAHYLNNTFSSLELPLIGIAAGSFLVVVFHDLIPKSIHYSLKSNKHFEHVMAFLFGILVIISINALTTDSHMHGFEDDHGHIDEVLIDHHDDGDVH